MKKINTRQWFIVLILSLCVGFFNILRVIIGYFQTPKGYAYLAVGHFNQDYFEYTQQIAQGIFGHWLVQNQFTTHDPTRTLIGWGQYIFIGKFALLFHLSPFTAYWITIFLFSIVLCILLFLVIRSMMPTSSFFYVICAFLFCIFSTPFIQFVQTNGQWTIVPYNFWYAPISMFHRIGGIPHHLATTICVLFSILFMDRILTILQTKKVRYVILHVTLLIIILLLLLTFGPLQVINVLMSLGIVGVIFIVKSLKRDKNFILAKRIILFVSAVGLCILPTALLIQKVHGSGELFQWVVAWEIAQQYYPAVSLVLLTIGPILLFIPFGIWGYIKSATPVRLLIFFLTLWSYLFASTSLAKYLGTFNLRFLTPLSYVLFGVLAVLGIKEISKRFPFPKLVANICIFGFLLYSITVTLIIHQSFGGVDPISYQPNELLRSMKTLNTQKDSKAVLTSPSQSLGMIVPCIVDRNVYLGRTFFTPQYEEKIGISDQFYQGNMSVNQAYQFLVDNDIGYVLLSSSEPYPRENLAHYPFLKELIRNPTLTIYKFQ